jgi:hypothetical protein
MWRGKIPQIERKAIKEIENAGIVPILSIGLSARFVAKKR